MARNILSRREPASSFLRNQRMASTRTTTLTGLGSRRAQAEGARAALLSKIGQVDDEVRFRAGFGASLQPKGFERSLALERDDLEEVRGFGLPGVNRGGRLTGRLFDPEADRPSALRFAGSRETFLTGRLRRTRRTPGGVAREPETLLGSGLSL